VMRHIGKDNKEGRAAIGVHGVQVQDAAFIEALQTVCYVLFTCMYKADDRFSSFELGGEKKTKGAALQFVCYFPFLSLFELTVFVVSALGVISYFVFHCYVS
jgi:hypothetical protein